MSSSKQIPLQPSTKAAIQNPVMMVREYCDRLKVSDTIFECVNYFYEKVSLGTYYREQKISAALAVASIFNACRGKRNVELISLCNKLKVPIDQVVHALWIVEACSAPKSVYRPSPIVTYEPPSWDREKSTPIVNAAGVSDPKTIKLSWSGSERLDFTLEGHYNTKSPHLTETYNRVLREIETASKKAAITKPSKRRAAAKKARSKKRVEKDEDREWDIIDSTDNDEKDKDWVEVSGRDLMAEKNEPIGWAGTMKRWFG